MSTKIKPQQATTSIEKSNAALIINDKQALLITLAIACISYVFSYFYTSFYQGEEGAQYMNALAFWHNKNLVLGNWPKTGWKILYAPIVLLGKQGTLIANCLFSAFSGFFAYKLASKICENKTVLPFIFLISQTLWFILAYKFYSEIPTAFFLVLAVYLFYCEKYIGFALCASFVLLLRQEFVFVFPYFVFLLLKRKQWISFLLLGTFPLLNNIWGWQATGDMLYLLNESKRYADSIKNSYPRQGFDHYFTMSGAIYSIVVVTLVVAYIAQAVTKQIKKVEYAILVPALGFFLVHCLFNLQAYPILTSTGGNLRYLLVVSPLMAVLAAKAIDNMQFINKKAAMLLLLVPLFCMTAAYMTFPHNWVVMNTESGERDMFPVLLCIMIILILLFIKNQATLVKSIALTSVLSMLIYIRPKELCCDENFEQKKITDYIVESGLIKKPIMQQLALMDFFYGKNKWDYPAGCTGISGDSSLDKAKVGSIIIWDTHYATKYGKVEFTYFQKNPTKYKMLKEFRSEDNTFAALVLEKIQ
ncbi:MAG: hypothetical protein ACOVO1_00915 [Chitinophagaceae bacterium]